jgi:4-hydroxy-2-oxoheptanedioate aldolase
MGPFYAPMRWGQSMPQYIEAANANVLAIVTIEHPDAVRNIDEVMSTPGLDLAVIGPGDLAMSLGIPGQFDHPKFKEAVASAEDLVASSAAAYALTPHVEVVERALYAADCNLCAI